MAWCQNCGEEFPYRSGDVVGRTSTCAKCNRDLHACVQCDHFDPRSNNQCREPNSDRVDNRLASNFCDFYRPKGKAPAMPGKQQARVDDARAKLDALFRKKDA
jgi:hypothetical protein